jgi:hypothetical protein
MRRSLEVQVARIDGRAHQLAQHALQLALVQPAGFQQLSFRQIFACNHGAPFLFVKARRRRAGLADRSAIRLLERPAR